MYDSLEPYENEREEREFPVTVSHTVSRRATVVTKDYTGDKIDSPITAYWESCCTLEDIIHFAKVSAEYFLEHNNYAIESEEMLKETIDACKDWVNDDISVEQD